MSWKRAVFFGGAVLLLAACDNATAPTSPSGLTRLGGVSAAAKAKGSDASTPAVTPDSTTSGVQTDCGGGGAVVTVGLDGQLLPVCLPENIIW